ncbi:MAG: hypothetical protein KGZ88_20570 [Methylomicrobium sp.]|nr:hypothetical protein [Methylomicrobium sp.]
MLSIQAEPADIAQSNAYGHRSQAVTNVVGQLFGQVRIETDLSGLIDDIRHRKDKADFETYRTGISCMILLAHSMRLVEEAEIDQAVTEGWEAIYRLYHEVVAKVMGHLNEESMRVAGVGVAHNDFEPMSIEMQQNKSEGVFLVLGVFPRFSQFSLLAMNRELARAVAGCLEWTIFNGGIGLTVDDLSEHWMMMGDELEALEETLETQGHLSNGELAEFFLDNDVYPFTEISDEQESLEAHIAFLKSILINNSKSVFGELPEIAEIRRMLCGWRKSNRAIYQNPWVKFIRETIKLWKWIEKSGLKASESNLYRCNESHGDVCLDYGHVIGFGFGWEEAVVSDVYDNIGQAGENPEGIIRLHPLACSEVGERLILLAKSRGLIRLAEVINSALEAESET